MKKEAIKKKIDPITLEVIRNALYSVSDEMSAALIRTAYSTNIKDRRDCSCAIYLTTGRLWPNPRSARPFTWESCLPWSIRSSRDFLRRRWTPVTTSS